jgi:SAM-dependent methyltransferase
VLNLFRRAKPTKTVRGVPMPPEHLIFMNPTADAGLRNAMKQVADMQKHGINTRNGPVLDIGCGWGRFAYGLLASDFLGEYIGIDLDRERIKWLSDNFTKADPRFRFNLDDVHNGRYNPSGKKQTSDYAGFLGNDSPSLVVLLSVFTHMYDNDIRSHLAQIVKVMNRDTVLFFTCFLFDGIATQGIRDGKARHKFPFSLSEYCHYDQKNDPLATIAYSEAFVSDAIREARLTATIRRGTWSGVGDGLFGQDFVIARLS